MGSANYPHSTYSTKASFQTLKATGTKLLPHLFPRPICFRHLGVGLLEEIAGAMLEWYSNAEIARRLGRSERTIERRLHLIREKCQQEFDGSR